ncbi:general transcription factor IIH, polypeptide 5, isoform CRA_a [Mus musculus]|nr:general transcription factor IIH, polypeptide 5, isoform CRA_a [Mus musculus]
MVNVLKGVLIEWFVALTIHDFKFTHRVLLCIFTMPQ